MSRQGLSGVLQPWRLIVSRRSSNVSTAVNSLLLRSLKEHYLEVSKMRPPPKVSPPPPFDIEKGAFESSGPVLRRAFGNEEIRLSAMRLANIVPSAGDDDEEDDFNQLFLHVDISKPGQENSLHFLCGLYPDALGIHSVSLRPKLEKSTFVVRPTKYNGPAFQDLEEPMRDALHNYIQERGINEKLFPFLQAWIYLKDHRNQMRWFRSVAALISEPEQTSGA